MSFDESTCIDGCVVDLVILRIVSVIVILILIHVNSIEIEWHTVPASDKTPVVLLIYQRSQWPTWRHVF
jgi:hypothetical protein